jgi:hypothetical protein
MQSARLTADAPPCLDEDQRAAENQVATSPSDDELRLGCHRPAEVARPRPAPLKVSVPQRAQVPAASPDETQPVVLAGEVLAKRFLIKFRTLLR